MVATGLSFVVLTAAVKAAGSRVPAAEAAFLRYALALPILVPMIGSLRAAGLTRGADPPVRDSRPGADRGGDPVVLCDDPDPARRGDGAELSQPDLRHARRGFVAGRRAAAAAAADDRRRFRGRAADPAARGQDARSRAFRDAGDGGRLCGQLPSGQAAVGRGVGDRGRRDAAGHGDDRAVAVRGRGLGHPDLARAGPLCAGCVFRDLGPLFHDLRLCRGAADGDPAGHLPAAGLGGVAGRHGLWRAGGRLGRRRAG